ncbi:MAG: class I SAM-dependent methyltransferase [Myxococcales bacterium]|nr:class I SAM-dependent methyltransferase [Myxococcales bacterium]
MSVTFWNAMATWYARKPIANPEAYEVKLAATRQHLTPTSRVLEIGCGTGSTALVHAAHVSSIHALDSSARMIEIATSKAAEQGVRNVAFEVGTAFEAPSGPFDVVLALNVLHLVEDLRQTLRRCHQLLGPGGVLIASTACITSGLEPWLIPVPAALGLLPAVRFFSVDALIEAHEAEGFSVSSCSFPGSPTGAFTVAHRVEG